MKTRTSFVLNEETDSMVFYRARYVVPISAPVIEDGALVVQEGRIVAIGKKKDLWPHYAKAHYHDLGEVMVMPGLINAHCHLDYTMMRGALSSKDGFTSWIKQLNQRKFSLQESDFLNGIIEGYYELRSWGCTTICNIESFPTLLPKLPSLPGRLWQFIEMMDIRGPEQGEECRISAEQFLAHSSDKVESKARVPGHVSWGLSPHAPQTTSQSLYREACLLAQKYKVPFCTHLAESEEEMEMFAHRTGPLFEFLSSLGRGMNDCGFQTPVQALLRNDLLPKGALLVHMNFLTTKDRELLQDRGHDFFVVHCPKTHAFFERPLFDWKFFQKHQYRLLLGTDSLASNDSLNLFQEMQEMAQMASELAPEEIVKMVTQHPACAIGMTKHLGELSSGAYADLITIPFAGEAEGLYEAIVHNEIPPIVISS